MLRIRTPHFAREPSSLSRIIIWKGLLYVGALASSFLLLFWQAPVSFSQSTIVVINEIGWMGTQESYDNEWLELFNTSNQTVYLSGWVFRSADGSPAINLSGAVEAGGYCLLERTNDSTIPDVPANFIYTGSLNNTGERLELVDAQGTIVDLVDAAGGGWFAGDNTSKKSMERIDPLVSGSDPSNWKTSDFSPGTPTSVGCDATAQPQNPQNQSTEKNVGPTIGFSAPSAVTVGQEFSVSVQLSNFEPGAYAAKVLVGKDGKFIYGNTKGGSGWLTQSESWDQFPTISESGVVQAKVDEDVAAGSYAIKVRVHKDDKNYDSAEKPLSVSSVPVGASGQVVSGGEGGEDLALEEVAVGEGKVLGEESPKGEGFKLNFYTILGIFGLLVGSGGLTLAFRRGARRSQTPDTPEQESTPLSERSCTPNG